MVNSAHSKNVETKMVIMANSAVHARSSFICNVSFGMSGDQTNVALAHAFMA